MLYKTKEINLKEKIIQCLIKENFYFGFYENESPLIYIRVDKVYAAYQNECGNYVDCNNVKWNLGLTGDYLYLSTTLYKKDLGLTFNKIKIISDVNDERIINPGSLSLKNKIELVSFEVENQETPNDKNKLLEFFIKI